MADTRESYTQQDMAPVTVVIAAEARDRAFYRGLLDPEEGIAVAGEARPGLGVLAAVARLRPRVLLLDFKRRRLDTLVALQGIRPQSPRTKVILLPTPRTSDAFILEGLKRGAKGYMDRVAARVFLAKAVRAVDAGEAWVPRRMVSKILDRLVRLGAAEPKARGFRTSTVRSRGV